MGAKILETDIGLEVYAGFWQRCRKRISHYLLRQRCM